MTDATIEPAAGQPPGVWRDVAFAVAAAAFALASAALAMYSVDRIGLGRPAAVAATFVLALAAGAAFAVPFRRVADPRVRTWLIRALSIPLGYLIGWYLIVPGFELGSTALIWAAFAAEVAACVVAFSVRSLRSLRLGSASALVGGLLAASLFTTLTTDGLLPT